MLVAAFVLALGAAGAPARSVLAATGCYPGNEFTQDMDFGAFWAMSTGSAQDASGKVTWQLSTKVIGNRGHGAWSATPGGLDGMLTATFALAGVHPFTFTSHCVQEATLNYYGSTWAPVQQTPDPGVADASATFEGVVDLPPWSHGDMHAVLTIGLEAGCAPPGCGVGVGGVPLAHAEVLLRHGVTCDTQDTAPYAYSVEDGSPQGSLTSAFTGKKGSKSDRARAGLPAGPTPGPQPCDGVTLDPDM